MRVIELGTVVAASFGTRLLADLGAEVIKVEAPGRPDPMREWGRVRHEGHALWWPLQSRNKKLVTIDLATESGRKLLLRLVEKADAVVENFRPGTLERWDLGYERLAEANPRIVLARVSGFGQTGPYAKRPGYAAVAEAMGGLRYVNGYPGTPPPRMGISLGDELAGLFAAQGVLAALYKRDALGGERGQVIDVSLVESCLAMLESMFPEYDLAGEIREPTGTGLPGVAPSNLFRTSDGKDMVIAANQDSLFDRLCIAIGRPELADDARFSSHAARAENQEEVEAIVAGWALAHDSAEIMARLTEAGVVCGPVYSVADIFADEHFREREMLVEHEDEELGRFLGPGVVPKFSETPGEVRWSGPWQPGSHNREVFGELLGLSDEEIEDLAGDAVIEGR
ncbi:MAG: CaiB/BaiF CoA transferase family protein [Solirubrobacterales bacterium]